MGGSCWASAAQVKGHNERRFSVPWSAPAPRMAEYVQAIRAIWHTWSTGEQLSYEGEHYRFSLMTPNFTPEPVDSTPPIMIAAVGPAMLRVAGQYCDGVRLHGFCTPDYLRRHVMPQLQTGLDRAGRDRSDFWVTGGGFICTGPDDETVDRMVEWVRYRIGFYGSTRAYWPVLEQHDLGDLGEKLNHLSRNDGWGEMAGCSSTMTWCGCLLRWVAMTRSPVPLPSTSTAWSTRSTPASPWTSAPTCRPT